MSHTHVPPDYWSRRHTESVVLDIGGDVGALVLYVAADMHGREIEVCPLGVEAPRRVHSAVLERSCNGRVMYAAVYPELAAGDYAVCEDGPTFTISPGAVTEVRF